MDSSSTSSGLLPAIWTHLEGTDVHARYYSECRGGDFFDGLMVGERVIFLLTDVAGAISNVRQVTQKTQSAFRQTAQELFAQSEVNDSDAVAQLTHAVNLALIEAAGGVRFSPTFLGCFNQPLGILTYCNGGNLLALFREGDKVRVLEPGGMPLGLFTHNTYEAAILALQNGDALLLATKGVSESKRGKEEFGVQRVMQLLAESSSLSASALCELVLQQAHDFANGAGGRNKQAEEQDLTALVLIRRAMEA
jgi:serine phosphatase RsbU (regulator of sigma subunit)